jgi:hypothetical protein
MSDQCPADIGPEDQDADGICDALDICPFVANPEQESQDACTPKPLKKVTAAERVRFELGFDKLHEFESIQDGLGPVFNERACAWAGADRFFATAALRRSWMQCSRTAAKPRARAIVLLRSTMTRAPREELLVDDARRY